MLLGCIADDFTGATDLASMLVRSGMRRCRPSACPSRPRRRASRRRRRCAQVAHDPRTPRPSRSRSPRWLAAGTGARQMFFKYCSTFDSTDAGNIGPVADALLDALGASFTIACPAFPDNSGRSTWVICSSAMRCCPIRRCATTRSRRCATPTSCACSPDRRAGVSGSCRARSRSAARGDPRRLRAASGEGVAHAVVDAIDDDDLMAIGAACARPRAGHRRVRRRARACRRTSARRGCCPNVPMRRPCRRCRGRPPCWRGPAPRQTRARWRCGAHPHRRRAGSVGGLAAGDGAGARWRA